MLLGRQANTEEGRFTKEDLVFVLDELFKDLKDGFMFEHDEIVLGMMVGFAGTDIEGDLITYFAAQRKAPIMHINFLARKILEERAAQVWDWCI